VAGGARGNLAQLRKISHRYAVLNDNIQRVNPNFTKKYLLTGLLETSELGKIAMK
jgi:hypothetical protein